MPQHDLKYFAKPLEEMLEQSASRMIAWGNKVENRYLPEHPSRKVAIKTDDSTNMENLGS